MYDQHLHSIYSFDSNADPVVNVQTAIERGLDGLIFTDHFDSHPDDLKNCRYDETAVAAMIDRLRAEFGEAMYIGKGIEVCYQPAYMDRILSHLQSHRFDMVMLSVHYFPPGALHLNKCWAGLSPSDGTRLYLEYVRDAVRDVERIHAEHGRVFDVLGHLDLVKRYTMRFWQADAVGEHADVIEQVLVACLEADMVPEINTSGIRQHVGEALPGPATVKQYAALGGKGMSIGSDAHKSEHIGADFATAAAMLREAGMDAMVGIRERERERLPLKTALTDLDSAGRR